MQPLGYLFKKIPKSPETLSSTNVTEIYSVSSCISKNFTDYVKYWTHNGFWLFDTPDLMKSIIEKENLNLSEYKLFYYEAFEKEFVISTKTWNTFNPDEGLKTEVVLPPCKHLEGFDIVTYAGGAPGCSPLSCNGFAVDINCNQYCLIETLEEAIHVLDVAKDGFGEPGPYRIIAVYSVLFTN